MAKDIFKFYCENTTLHGFKYMTQKSNRFEKWEIRKISKKNSSSLIFLFHCILRFFWLSALIVSFVLSIVLTYKFLRNTEKNPIVIYVVEKHVNVADINFPAITLCPGLILADADDTKLDYDKIVNNLKSRKISLDDLTENESAKSFFLHEISNFFDTNFRLKLMQITSLISNDIFMSSLNISIPTDDFIERLDDFMNLWESDKDDEFDYQRLMSASWYGAYKVNLIRVLHRKGFCFTFNSANVSEIFNFDE